MHGGTLERFWIRTFYLLCHSEIVARACGGVLDAITLVVSFVNGCGFQQPACPSLNVSNARGILALGRTRVDEKRCEGHAYLFF